MQSDGLGTLLDDGGHELGRLLVGFGLAVSLALLLAIALPMVLLGRLLPVAALPSWNLPASAPAASAPQLPAPGQPLHHAVDVARGYLGVPYVFGGTDPRTGLDCSGLVQLVYRQLGVGLPRTAQLQYDATDRVGREQLQPGDLVFFARTYADPRDWITHVGIYVGDGMQVNAPTPGQVVSIQPAFSGFWGAHFVSGGRVRAGAANPTLSGGSAT